MSTAEDFRERVTIILAGYKDDIDKKLFAFNAGLASRFQTINFEDFSQPGLYRLWKYNCDKEKWKCDPKIGEVASRRLARSIGRKGFGNARSVRVLFESALSHAKARYFKEHDLSKDPTIIMEDVIGLPPRRELNPELDAILSRLDKMTGQKSIKESLYNLVRTAENNYNLELRGSKIDDIPLNRLFLGNPGKTLLQIESRIFNKSSLINFFISSIGYTLFINDCFTFIFFFKNFCRDWKGNSTIYIIHDCAPSYGVAIID
jgi:hypothetical protein